MDRDPASPGDVPEASTLVNGATARWLNSLLGAWQFVSAFFWPHTAPQSGNSWTMGFLIAIVALIGLRVPGVRFINTALGIWLIASTFVLPSNWPATHWNDVLVGVAVVALSLVPPRRSTRDQVA